MPANVPDLLGRRVKKHFRAEDGSRELRPFEGEVVAFDAKVGWYTIKYDDGDVEELDRPAAVSRKARDFRVSGAQSASPDVTRSTKDDF